MARTKKYKKPILKFIVVAVVLGVTNYFFLHTTRQVLGNSWYVLLLSYCGIWSIGYRTGYAAADWIWLD